MAFYDTYGDSQARRLQQQQQNNQALQAFADFMQRQQQNKATNQIAQDSNVISMIRSGYIPQGQQIQAHTPRPSISVGGPSLTPQQLAMQNQMNGINPPQDPIRAMGQNFVRDPNNSGTGVYSFNPVTGALEQIATVAKGSVVRNQMSVDDRLNAAYASGTGTNKASRESDSIKTSKNLAKLVRGLDVLNRQYDEVLGDKETSALYQRFAGPAAVFGAKTGLNPNPKLLSLKKNERLQAVQVVRMAGDVGAIPQQQIDETTAAIANEGLTGEEREAAVRQFLEFALANADDVGSEELRKSKSFMRVVNRYGITFEPDEEVGGSYDADKEARYQAWKAKQTGGV